MWRCWCLVEIFCWCLVEILKMKCDQDLCLNFWYDFKKLLWQDELNPRVRCAFGNVFFIFRDIFHILLVSFYMTGMCRCPPPSPKMHLTKFFLLKLFDFFHIFLIFFLIFSWFLLCDKDVKIPPAAEMDLANCLLLWIFCPLKIQCFFLVPLFHRVRIAYK